MPVEATDGAEPVHHLMVIEVDERDRVAEHLRKNGIATGIHYPLPLHLQPALAYLKRRAAASRSPSGRRRAS